MQEQSLCGDSRTPAALKAVAQAAQVARMVQVDQSKRQITKDDQSPVTVADFAVQAIVALSLAEGLGSVRIVGEEHAGELRKPEQRETALAVMKAVQTQRPDATLDEVLDAIDECDHDGSSDSYWTLDPIDGTKGFLRGQQYAIALALIEQGEVSLGVMGCPNLPIDQSAPLDVADSRGCIFLASRRGGESQGGSTEMRLPVDGKFLPNGRRLHSSTVNAGQPIRACESVEAAHSKHDDTAAVLRELAGHDPLTPARLDSQCKYAVVARGQADLYLRLPTKKSYVEKVWDHAAGMIIAQEAGAIVTDITGTPLDFSKGRRLESNRGIVCAAAGIHSRVIHAIERLGIGAPA